MNARTSSAGAEGGPCLRIKVAVPVDEVPLRGTASPLAVYGATALPVSW
ncbi:hypothetical protein [Streptomyces sp. NPDC048057]